MSATSSAVSTARAAPEAYVKVALHALRHPTQPVVGLLIGKRIGEGGSTTGAGGGGASSGGNGGTPPSLFVTDVVPVMHTQVLATPSPVFDAVLFHAQAVARTNGTTLLGLYVANEIASDESISEHTIRALRVVSDRVTGQPVLLWVLRGEEIALLTACAIRQTLYAGGTPSRTNGEATAVLFARWNADTCAADDAPAAATGALLEAAMDRQLSAKLVDFEDHLEDVCADFFNEGLLAGLA